MREKTESRLRQRGWVLVARNRITNKIICYNGPKDGWSESHTRVSLKVVYRSSKPEDFINKDLPKGSYGVLMGMNYKDEWDVFISRIGSKKCPIKIKWSAFFEKLKRRPKEQDMSTISVGFTPRENI